MTNQVSLINTSSIITDNNIEDNKFAKINKSNTLILKLKVKSPKKNRRFLHSSSIETTYKSNEDSQIRKDFFGVEICKKNKGKFRVTFADEVNNNDDCLVDIIPVENYKIYNYDIYKRKNDSKKETVMCSGCLILWDFKSMLFFIDI